MDGAVVWRPVLPLRFECPFQLWSYTKSHRTLVFRGRPGEGYDEFVDVVFSGVLGMKVASGYGGLVVAVASEVGEVDDFVRVPDRHRRSVVKLAISDEVHRGFVVCGRVGVRRGTGWSD